jgi:hypothetical protein
LIDRSHYLVVVARIHVPEVDVGRVDAGEAALRDESKRDLIVVADLYAVENVVIFVDVAALTHPRHADPPLDLLLLETLELQLRITERTAPILPALNEQR